MPVPVFGKELYLKCEEVQLTSPLSLDPCCASYGAIICSGSGAPTVCEVEDCCHSETRI
jgi:hypothetical protein